MSKNQQEYTLVLEKYLQNKSRQFTINDAASVTGMPLLETEESVRELMDKYDCKLKVTEGGDLVYDFGTKLHRRTAKPFSEYFKDFLRLLWKGFTVFYKVLISAFLVIYFVIFLLLVIGLVVAMLSGGRDNDGSKGAGKIIYALFRVFLSIFQWSTILGYNQTYHRQDRYGYNYKHYKEKPGILQTMRGIKEDDDPKEKKGFVASIYDFVFGPPEVPVDPFANEQEVASYLLENKGLVIVPELQALAGWTRDNADNFMTRLLANFDGKAEISPNGMLYGDFSELTRRKDQTGDAPIIYYWDEYEPEPELTGNKMARNAGIIAMNSFNLILSILVLWGPIGNEILELGTGGMIVLGWIPFVYSFLFFLIPGIRALSLASERRKQHINNVRKRLMKTIFQEHTAQITAKQLTAIANQKRKTEEVLDEKTVEKVMMSVIYDLNGESFLDENNEIAYKFERLDQELDEIEKLRKEKRDEGDLSKIVFEA